MSSRDLILGNLCTALGSAEKERRRREIIKRFEQLPRAKRPSRLQVTGHEKLDLFIGKVRASAASIDILPTETEIPSAVAQYLKYHNDPAQLKVSPNVEDLALSWEGTSLTIEVGAAVDGDHTCFSVADLGVCETGTLVLTSGPDNPTTLNFLPDVHLVLLRRSQLVASYEDAWKKLREGFADVGIPRTINMITGPSRTADIEQTLQMGAHGPRRLHILLLDDTP